MLLGITEHDLESYLSQALAAGGDYADLYCEYLATSQLSIDESIVKSAIQGVSLGVGVRVISGELNKALGASRGLFCAADSPFKIDLSRREMELRLGVVADGQVGI